MVLSDEEYAIYLTRVSPLSATIKSMGLPLSKDAFDAVVFHVDANPQLRSLIMKYSFRPSNELYNLSLPDLIGLDNYHRLLELNDPVYALMRQQAQRGGLPVTEFNDVYKEFVNFQLLISESEELGDEANAQHYRSQRDQALRERMDMVTSAIVQGLLTEVH